MNKSTQKNHPKVKIQATLSEGTPVDLEGVFIPPKVELSLWRIIIPGNSMYISDHMIITQDNINILMLRADSPCKTIVKTAVSQLIIKMFICVKVDDEVCSAADIDRLKHYNQVSICYINIITITITVVVMVMQIIIM